MNACGKADDRLSIAAKSIAEIIPLHGKVNLDFDDVRTIVKDGGVASMGTGYGVGENRLTKAIDDSLHSPLLNNNDIFNAQKVMLNVSYCPDHALMMEEMTEVHTFMSKFKENVEVIWGVAEEQELGEKVKITILATGFGVEDVPGMESVLSKRRLEDEVTKVKSEEETERIKMRIAKAYGSSADGFGLRQRIKRNNIYLFSIEDLDNDDIIAEVENSSTYYRDKATLTKMKERSKEEELVSSPTITGGEEVITF